MHQPTSTYGRVAGVYDALARLYSGSGIARTRAATGRWLKPGDRVLYPGAGTGHECAEAAARGVQVTLLDSSAAMLARARARFDAHGLRAQWLHSSLDAVGAGLGGYDAVVASFFLNTFRADDLPSVFAQLGRVVRPGGLVICADFAAPSDARALRALQRLYYLPPLALFAAVAGNPWHSLYDYAQVAREVNDRAGGDPRAPLFSDPERQTISVAGLPLFEALCWTVHPDRSP